MTSHWCTSGSGNLATSRVKVRMQIQILVTISNSFFFFNTTRRLYIFLDCSLLTSHLASFWTSDRAPSRWCTPFLSHWFPTPAPHPRLSPPFPPLGNILRCTLAAPHAFVLLSFSLPQMQPEITSVTLALISGLAAASWLSVHECARARAPASLPVRVCLCCVM